MSQFIRDAFLTGVKEGAKLSLCVLLLLAYFRARGYEELKKPLMAGLAVLALASLALLNTTVTVELRSGIVTMIGFVFGLFYFFSLGALLHTTGTDMLGPLHRTAGEKPVLAALVFLLTLVYFLPDMAAGSLYVSDLFFMSEKRAVIVLAAGAGFFLALGLSALAGSRVSPKVMRLFGLPQVLLFLALVKLAAGGVRGFTDFSLIPSVQAGLMKLIHDFVHQVFVMIMVPDHPVLSVTAWGFIGSLFGQTAGLWLSLILFAVPLAIFLRKHFSEAMNIPPEAGSGAARRRFIKTLRDERLLKSLPVFAFMLFIVSTWFVQSGEGVTRLYNPQPRPVAAEAGMVVIPLQTPAEDLMDGSIHKFSIALGGTDMRLLVMKKPDGTLAVCLDACEICQPDGYGQGPEHVVCLYCKTPIPFDTVGSPGGCNPIPVDALVTEKEVRIPVSEISTKWKLVAAKTGAEGAEK